MERFRTVYLADYPQYIETCAAWHFTAWGIKSDQRTLQKDIEKFKLSINKDRAPLTLVTIDTQRNVPVAMNSIWLDDNSYWSELNPWITGLYVHEDYRGQGLALNLMSRIEEEAKKVSIDKIYLTASAATALYEKLNYKCLDKRNAPETPTGLQTLFCKTF